VSQSIFQQFFEEFSGVDLLASDLTRDPNAAKRFINCSFLNSRTINKRPGVAGVGCPGQFMAIKSYIYRDSDTGLDIEKLVGIKRSGVYTLETASAAFSLASGGSIAFSWNTVTTQIDFNYSVSGVLQTTLSLYPVSNFTTDSFTYGTIYDLLAWIDGLSGCSVTTWPAEGGLVAAGGVSPTTNVNAITTLGNDAVFVTLSSTVGLQARRGYKPTATTMVLESATFTTAGEELGSWLSPVTSIVGFGEDDSIELANTGEFSFYYWKPVVFCVYEDINGLPFFGLDLVPSIDNKVSAANANDSLYICTSTTALTDIDKLQRGNYNYLGTASSTFQNKLMKYDGLNLYRAGAPVMGFYVAADAAGTAVAIGEYEYAIACYMKDFNGYETWGNIATYPLSQVAAKDVNVSMLDGDDDKGFSSKAGYVYTGGTGTSFYIESRVDLQKLQPGDWFGYSSNSATGAPALSWKRVVSVDYTLYNTGSYLFGYQVTLDSTITIANNSYITGGAYCKIYRTVGSGTTFYKVGEQCLAWGISVIIPIVFKDTVIDPTGNERLIDPDKGKIWNGGNIATGGSYHGVTNCSLVTSHQGALVLSGDPINPNIMVTSEPGDIEYFPLAFNVIETPSNAGGALTAIESQTNDILLAFKENAIYEVAGDLAGQAYSIRTLTTYDYGVSGTTSITRFKDISICANNSGIFAIAGGEVDDDFAKVINPLINRKDFAYNLTQVVNDRERQLLLFCFVDSSSFVQSSSRPLEGHQVVVYDYNKKAWGTYDYPNGKPLPGSDDFWCMQPTGGWSLVNSEMYHLSMIRNKIDPTARAFGQVYKTLPENGGTDASSRNLTYFDDGLAISQSYRTAWLTLSDPGVDKYVPRINIYSVQDEGDSASLVGSTFARPTQNIGVSIYRNFDESTIKGNYSLSIPASTRYFDDAFKGYKSNFRSIQLDLFNTTAGSTMQLTGFELVWKLVNKKEDIRG